MRNVVAVWARFLRLAKARRVVCSCGEMGTVAFPTHFRAKHTLELPKAKAGSKKHGRDGADVIVVAKWARRC